jgi:hypothetical protein
MSTSRIRRTTARLAFWGAALRAFALTATIAKPRLGIDAGVKLNLPSFGAGDDFILTGSYTQNAALYLGFPVMMWGENAQVNGNGQKIFVSDAFWNPLTNSGRPRSHGRPQPSSNITSPRSSMLIWKARLASSGLVANRAKISG